MNIQRINFYSQNVVNANKTQQQKKHSHNDLQPLVTSSIYTVPYFINFKGLQSQELQEFDFDSLEDKKITDEFEGQELRPSGASINISPVFDAALSSFAEEKRYFDRNGSLPQHKIQSIIEDCRWKGLSEEDAKKKIEHYGEYSQGIIQKANSVIDSLNPTEKEHRVYRIVSESYIPESRQYIEELSNLKPNEEVVLSPTPIYVSTSAKKTVKNYGMGANNSAIKSILFKINLPKGSKMLILPSNDGIEQGIMKGGAKFKVVDNQEFKNNFRVLTLDYLPE